MAENSETSRPDYSMTTKILMAGIAVGLLAAIAWLPSLLVKLDAAGRSLDGVHRVEATGHARQVVLQAIGGFAVLIGGYVAYRRLRVSEAELQISRDGQVTERFTQAVEHLGSGNADVRVGGIHALGRISRNSPGDRDAIVAILSTFVRGKAPWHGSDKDAPRTMDSFHTLSTRAPDVQAALSVLAGIPRSADGDVPRLSFTDLRRARMWGLNFDRASFSAASLQGARLGGASLVNADLGHCDLREADLADADLTGALLWCADLSGAILTGATLKQAKFDASTKWPAGFEPSRHDTVLVRQPPFAIWPGNTLG